ncbi:MAG TPA: four-helix bundle copper-binding protein [Polyangiaceae bacterium]|nr:four-helix bundle copper-binding protein [Polyangiaceae bacterium]
MATTTTSTNGGVQLASSTPAMQGMTEQMRRCIQDCLECANICEQTIQFCLQLGGKHAAPDHIRLLRDCAETCLMSAAMMSRGSHFHRQHCALCAEICKACADSCARLGREPQLQTCADACRKCEQSCRQM